MPELPEVEYTARQLREAIIGATIREVLVFWERTIGHPELPDFQAEVAGCEIQGVRRRGKFLILDLSRDLMLTIHRRMTGNLLLLPPGWEIDTSLKTSNPVAWNIKGPSFHLSVGTDVSRPSPIDRPSMEIPNQNEKHNIDPSDLLYCRACFNLVDGRRLLYTDPRKFGRIELWPRKCEQKALKNIGIEPLSEDFTPEILTQILAGRKSPIKQALLNQEVIAGLGNIYADEALFYASIHPLRRTDSLTPAEIQLLHEGIISVLRLGIENGGTSFSEFRDLWGETGDNYSHVRVYHQQGQPCPRCGTPIERIVVAQRGTHFCPNCQKLILE
jgi:formamidopyrimidine-DNA glycosylase